MSAFTATERSANVATVQRRVVVLGTGPIAIDPGIPREGPRTLSELLADRPDAAVVACEGAPAFFRASLALERGVPPKSSR